MSTQNLIRPASTDCIIQHEEKVDMMMMFSTINKNSTYSYDDTQDKYCSTAQDDSFQNANTSSVVKEQFDSNASLSTSATNLVSSMKKTNHARTVALVSINSLTYIGVSALQKSLMSGGVHLAELAFFKTFVALICFSVYMCFSKRNPFAQSEFPKKLRGTMTLRSIVGTLSFIGMVYNLTLIPMAIVFVVYQTNPFWCSLLGYILNKDPVYCFEIAAMFVAFIGVIIIACAEFTSADSELASASKAATIGGILLALTVAWAQGIILNLNRRMYQVHFSVVMFNHCLISTLMVSVYIIGEAAYNWQMFRFYTCEQYKLILVVCVFDLIQLSSITLASQSDKPSFVALLTQVSIVYAFLADYFIFDESIAPLQITGALIIMIVTIGVGIYKVLSSTSQ